jgi:hypothetical protein
MNLAPSSATPDEVVLIPQTSPTFSEKWNKKFTMYRLPSALKISCASEQM